MKLLLTSAGYAENSKIAQRFLKLVGKKPIEIKIFLVTTATEKDKGWKWVKFTIKQLEKIGIASRNISIFSLNRRVGKEDLKDIDVVYVCGGNTFVYLDKIRKTGLDEKIKEFVKAGKVYFGVSAGSYIACPNINMATWKHANVNIVNIQDLTSLNLVPFLITAHFKEEYRSIIEKAARKTSCYIIALTDKQAVLVRGKKVEIIGIGKKNVFNTLCLK